MAGPTVTRDLPEMASASSLDGGLEPLGEGDAAWDTYSELVANWDKVVPGLLLPGRAAVAVAGRAPASPAPSRLLGAAAAVPGLNSNSKGACSGWGGFGELGSGGNDPALEAGSEGLSCSWSLDRLDCRRGELRWGEGVRASGMPVLEEVREGLPPLPGEEVRGVKPPRFWLCRDAPRPGLPARDSQSCRRKRCLLGWCCLHKEACQTPGPQPGHRLRLARHLDMYV